MKLLRLQNMKEKYRDFHFGEFIEKPNQCGYFEQNARRGLTSGAWASDNGGH